VVACAPNSNAAVFTLAYAPNTRAYLTISKMVPRAKLSETK